MKAHWLRVLVVMSWIASACASFVACPPAVADPAPRTMVRAHLEPAGPVVAGSEVKLVVDLLTTAWFAEAPNWPLFTVPDAIVTLPDEDAQNLSEDIDGVHWFGVSRAYRIAPQAGKTYEIAPFAITVYPGGTNAPVRVMTPALKFVSTLPPGAEDMGTFFATTKLTATQKIEPPKGPIRVGDSVTRTITQRATGTESMLIPPLGLGEVDGLKRYTSPSTTRNVVQDRVGLVAGERTDSVTYIADHSGRFKLPPVTIEWWNSTTRKKETIILPGATFPAAAVHEKPLFKIPVETITRGMPHRILVIHSRQLILGCVIALGVFILVWARARIATLVRHTRERAREARTRFLESDAMAWRALRAVGRKGDLRRTIPALYRWMDRSPDFGHPARLESLTGIDDAGPQELVAAVNAHYAGGNAPELRWDDAAATLQQSRKRTRLKHQETRPLPELNEY